MRRRQGMAIAQRQGAVDVGQPGLRGAHHLMLEVNSLDDVGTAVDRCADLEVPVSKSIGCHTNDRMVSTYLFSPSVLRVEYGWGGLAIDDLWARWRDEPLSTAEASELDEYLGIHEALEPGGALFGKQLLRCDTARRATDAIAQVLDA